MPPQDTPIVGQNASSYQILWQVSKRQLTQCKRMSIVSEDRVTGEKKFMLVRMWEVHVQDNRLGKLLKIRLRLNESNQPTFTIQQPDTQIFKIVVLNKRKVQTQELVPKKGETEKFDNIKALKSRLAGFLGWTMAGEVVGLFIQHTPLGDS